LESKSGVMKNPPILSLDRIVALCNTILGNIVNVDAYEYAPCYLWYDRPLYDEFGEEIVYLPGDTIYLYQNSTTPVRDLFHELGHVVGRKCNLVGNAENGFRGDWEQKNGKLIAEVSGQRHWSNYLNLFSRSHDNFKANAASEVWAELFMMWHLYPHCAESRLLDEPMEALRSQSVYDAISNLALELDVQRIQVNANGTRNG